MTPPRERITDTARLIAPAAPLLAIAGAAALAAAYTLQDGAARASLAAGGATLLALAVVLAACRLQAGRSAARLRNRVAAVAANDPDPCIATDAKGIIRQLNDAARARLGDIAGEPVTSALAPLTAHPQDMALSLQKRAERDGHALREMPMANGALRLSAHRLEPEGLLWRSEMRGHDPRRPPDFGALSLPIAMVAPDGTITALNDALAALLGGRPDAVGALFRGAPPEHDGPVELDTADGPLQRRLLQRTAPDGTRELYFLPADPAPPSRPAAADPLADSDALPVALIGLRRDGTVAHANAEARRLLDLDGGDHFGDLVEGLGRPVDAWLRDALDGRAIDRPEILQARRVTPERFVQVTLRAGRADGPALIALVSDATELKSLEAKFVQSQKMQAIGQLAGGVAHDFNNLLTAISGQCDLLLTRRGEEDPDYPDLMQIHHNTNRAASLVGQLLAFSRKQSHKPEILDLHDTLSDLTHLLDRLVGERVRLQLELPSDPLHLRADKRQFEQVLVNLVVNARDAMPEGGNVVIAARLERLENALHRDRAMVPAGDHIRITVTDEGTGIAPDQLDRLFEPFYSTKKPGEGTGLGLSTVYGIMKQSGGFVFCDSTPGAGTTFTLFLPVADAAPAAPAETARQAPQAQENAVVLLVEDEAPVRAFAARALRLRGYSVIEADSAEEALERLADDALHVDIFVTDVTLPGLDGPGWVREALATRPDTPIVFISGHASDIFAELREEIPNATLLAKPFSINELWSATAAQLAAPCPPARRG